MQKKTITIALLSAILILISSVIVYTYPNGYTGRTKKNSTQGCGSCHSQNTSITSAIAGPDTVTAGETVNFTWTVTRAGSSSKAGCDIAVNLGTLAPGPGSSYLKLSNSELTNKSGLSLSGGTFTCQFSYTAPASGGIDTIWLTSAVGHSNGWNWGTEKKVVIRSPLGINNSNTPEGFKLSQNYPNPFNPSTTISFKLPAKSEVKITVMDISGKFVESLIHGQLPAGSHEVIWNAEDYSTGIYFYSIETGTYKDTRKMILIK